MIEIYTDGATSNNGYKNSYGGWAYIGFDLDKNLLFQDYGYIPNTTNNYCELTAILEACKKADKYDEDFTIYSDSAYCINCYNQGWFKKWQVNGWKNSKKEPVANKELWEQLIPFFENKKFQFKKVKGHATDIRNIMVDELAVAAKESGYLD